MVSAWENTSLALEFELYELELLDAPGEAAFDNLTRLGARSLNSRYCCLFIAEPSRNRQFLKSGHGVVAMDRVLNETQINPHILGEVLRRQGPVRVPDARKVPGFDRYYTVADLGVYAYLAVPVRLSTGELIGTLSASDPDPRDWTDDDIATLIQIAQSIEDKITLKQALKTSEVAEERAQQLAEARQRFLAHMSHEIRTPLNGILGCLDLLQGQDLELNQAQNELFSTMERSTRNLLKILNESLDLSKIDAGMLDIHPAPFNPSELAHNVIDLFKSCAEAKGIALELSLHGLDDGQFRNGDRFRLQQVLDNLIGNAVKFTDTGSVELRIEGTDDLLFVEVSDTGPGIPEGSLAELFEPYRQAKSDVASTKGGTGLGLAICEKILGLMGGSITVQNLTAGGAQFLLNVPLPVCAPPEKAAGDVVTRSSFAGARVLIADDSAANRMILDKMLVSLGADVVQAQDGDRALELASGGGFDVLMLDINMPGLSGEEVVKRLRAEPPEPGSRPLAIAVTGDVSSEHVARYMQAGFDRFLSKPLRLSDLQKTFSRAAE